ncbi:hypothetical protein BRARA_E00006 [Brassica rapa]|uniref:Uncharacterized protein n=2 Tax=Brassica TaxID=3705 RepID=A0A397Z576_BRACM|nr:hypothetical protein BRARA_E00006 [Brassica rapa]
MGKAFSFITQFNKKQVKAGTHFNIEGDELHSRVSLLVCLFLNYFFVKFLFSNQNKTNTPTQIKTRQIHISCALPLTKGPQPNQPILSFTTSIAVYLFHPFLHLKVSQETFPETHSQKERKKSMGVSLFVGFTLLSLCLPTSTSELLQFQLSTISAAPSFLPEAPSSFSASPPEATSPDISPLFPTPGSSEMSPSPSESSAMPTIPSSLSPPNPDAVARDPLLDTSPVGSPLPASSSVSLVWSPLSLLLVFPMLLLLPFSRFSS